MTAEVAVSPHLPGAVIVRSGWQHLHRACGDLVEEPVQSLVLSWLVGVGVASLFDQRRVAPVQHIPGERIGSAARQNRR